MKRYERRRRQRPVKLRLHIKTCAFKMIACTLGSLLWYYSMNQTHMPLLQQHFFLSVLYTKRKFQFFVIFYKNLFSTTLPFSLLKKHIVLKIYFYIRIYPYLFKRKFGLFTNKHIFKIFSLEEKHYHLKIESFSRNYLLE